MKILCLHGMGTNADIFKAQTASFRALLPSHFTFEFLEGDHDCPAAAGIAEVYPKPYICWYPSPPTLNRVADTHKTIREIIREDGPFDGVMGFSQGAALAASVLLHHQLESPLDPPLFRFAVFICGSLPFSISQKYGFDLADMFTHHDDPLPGCIEQWKHMSERRVLSPQSYFSLPRSTIPRLSNSPENINSLSDDNDLTDLDSGYNSPYTPATPPQPLLADGTQQGVITTTLTSSEEVTEVSVNCSDSNGPVHRFHPALDRIRISIPTAHIYGKNDPYIEQSIQLIHLCQKSLVNVLDHGGAHEIPRFGKTNQSIADLIEKTVARSEVIF